MNDKIKWPQKGDNPFLIKAADSTSATWCCLHYLASIEFNDSSFAMAFKEAADKIINELTKGEDYKRPDIYFFPIAYLYRHSLELKMKIIIELAIQLKLIESNENIDKTLRSHNLHKLWNLTKVSIKKYSSEKSLNSVEKIIQEFHKIYKTGQNLRYSENTAGQTIVNSLPESVELTHLKDVFEAVYNFFEGCEMVLDDELYTYNEMMYDSYHDMMNGSEYY